LLLLLLIILPGIVFGSVVDPYSGHYYEIYYTDSIIDWHQAKDTAENMGGHLAVITSEAEQALVYSLLSTNDTAWIGGTDYVVEEHWIWITGESFAYTNWDTDEPAWIDNFDYIQIFQEDGGKWKAKSSGCRGFIVEYYCCEDELTGNVNCDDSDVVNIFDIVRLIDYLYLSGEPLCCYDQANVDGDLDNIINIFDITRLIDYLYLSNQPIAACKPGNPVYQGDPIYITDSTERMWDITHAFNFYGMDSANFNFGFGPDAILPILEPKFSEPGDDDYPLPTEEFSVIGLEIGDNIRAYRTEHLNNHEIVNDLVDTQSVAVMYCPLPSLSEVYTREMNGEVLTLSASGWMFNYITVFYDYETESLWSPTKIGTEYDTTCGCLLSVTQLLCVQGQYAGKTLSRIKSHSDQWDEWYSDFPDSWIMKDPD